LGYYQVGKPQLAVSFKHKNQCMKSVYIIIFFLLPTILEAQQTDNPIDPNSAELMAAFNDEFITIVNLKRAETSLVPLVVSDSLTQLATHYVGLFIGIGERDLPSNTTDHYFVGCGTKGKEVAVEDVVRAQWVTSGDVRFPGIKAHYTKVGIASILRKEDLLNYESIPKTHKIKKVSFGGIFISFN